VRHSIYIERRKAQLARDVVRMVNGVTGDLYGMIATSDLDGLTRRQLDRLLREVEYVIRAGYDPIKGTISEQLREFGIYEADFQTRLVERMGSSVDIGVPSDADIWAAVNSRPFEGKFLTGWLDGLPSNTANRVTSAIRQGYVDGRGPLDIAREIRGTRTRRGVMDISARGAEAMVRTAMAHTASMAKEQTYKGRRGIREVQWVSVLDHRTSDICRANDGKIFPKNEGPRPPAHVNCLTGDSLISASPGITGASKRWFNGEVIRIKTSSDRKLTCTPNHPILTDKGWVAAGDLNFTHKIACRVGSESMALVGAQDNNAKASIADVAEAFFADRGVVAVPVPISAPDFHGDGANSEVAIVGSYRGLGVKANAEVSERIGNPQFITGNHAAPSLRGFDLFCHAFLAAPRSIMGFFSQAGDFFWRCAIHTRLLLLGSVSWRPAVVGQDFGDYARACAELLGNASGPNAFVKHSDNLLGVDATGRSLMISDGGHVVSLQGPEKDGMTDSDLAENILRGNAFNVEFDSLVNLDRVSFSGHVFNLETVDGYYLADNIVTHNCRSTVIPVTKGNRKRLQERETYQDWLKRQSKAVQDDILGPSRGKLYREGGYSVSRFVDESGQKYTLDDLRKKDADTFVELFGE
jgi:SPP1 gp7 family putative phage head morphogenesis protein